MGPGEGADAEPAAMEVEEDGEPGSVGPKGFVEAEAEIVGGVELGVFKDDGRVGEGGRGGEDGVRGAADGAVAEELEEAAAVFNHVRRGRAGAGE